MTVQVRQKSSFAVLHRQNAVFFQDKAKRIEALYSDENSSDIPTRDTKEHRAYVINSLFCSIGFLEALANEIIFNLAEDEERTKNGHDPRHYPDIDPSHRGQVMHESNLRNRIGEASLPIKYNVLLDVMDLNEFDRDSDPLEPVLLLNRLRNELVHFEPEWTEGGSKEYTENEYGFEEDLKDRFKLNPLTAEGNSFFPSQTMSYGCAKWATRHSRALAYHFSNRIDIEITFILDARI